MLQGVPEGHTQRPMQAAPLKTLFDLVVDLTCCTLIVLGNRWDSKVRPRREHSKCGCRVRGLDFGSRGDYVGSEMWCILFCIARGLCRVANTVSQNAVVKPQFESGRA